MRCWAVCVICGAQNVEVMKCLCCKIVNKMFVKITSNHTIKKVYINLEISNIKVIDKSLINFADMLYI